MNAPSADMIDAVGHAGFIDDFVTTISELG